MRSECSTTVCTGVSAGTRSLKGAFPFLKVTFGSSEELLTLLQALAEHQPVIHPGSRFVRQMAWQAPELVDPLMREPGLRELADIRVDQWPPGRRFLWEIRVKYRRKRCWCHFTIVSARRSRAYRAIRPKTRGMRPEAAIGVVEVQARPLALQCGHLLAEGEVLQDQISP